MIEPDRILSLAQVHEMNLLPLSKSTLYEVAREADSPFWMRGGRWMTVESDLKDWVRKGQKRGRYNRERGYAEPMPSPKVKRGALMARVMEIRREG